MLDEGVEGRRRLEVETAADSEAVIGLGHVGEQDRYRPAVEVDVVDGPEDLPDLVRTLDHRDARPPATLRSNALRRSSSSSFAVASACCGSSRARQSRTLASRWVHAARRCEPGAEHPWLRSGPAARRAAARSPRTPPSVAASPASPRDASGSDGVGIQLRTGAAPRRECPPRRASGGAPFAPPSLGDREDASGKPDRARSTDDPRRWSVVSRPLLPAARCQPGPAAAARRSRREIAATRKPSAISAMTRFPPI